MFSTSPMTVVANLFRGALIGLAELVPGISGGTVALIVGIYEKALHNANLLLDLARRKNKAAHKEIEWAFLAAVGAGMLGAVFGCAHIMHSFVENYPEISRGLFLGMVAMSLLVPFGMVDRRKLKAKGAIYAVLFLALAAIAFIGTGFTATPHENPSLIVIFFAAAVAVCALVLPGLSGSFVLLALGLYEPVIGAVKDRDVAVIGIFCLGALTGIVCFVKALNWMMGHHRTPTLIAMAGLMLGSLRALWPWQDSEGSLIAPYSEGMAGILGCIVLGMALVAALLAVDIYHSRKTAATVINDSEPHV